MKLLDPRMNSTYNCIIEFYGDLLYRWKFPNKRVEVSIYILNTFKKKLMKINFLFLTLIVSILISNHYKAFHFGENKWI